jgi:cell division septation protein DedD
LASPPPRAADAGNYVVQLSAQKSESEAAQSFRAMQAKYPSVLSGRQPLIRKKDLGSKGTYYGAQVGPFASREQAVKLCEDLKSAGGSCLVQRN